MITITNLSKNFDERMLLKDVSLSIFPNERIGLTGPQWGGEIDTIQYYPRAIRADSRVGADSKRFENWLSGPRVQISQRAYGHGRNYFR